MHVIAMACLASMCLVGVVVGFRLIGLACRTRELPETLMGLGLVIVAVIGAPLTGVGRMPGMVGTPFGDALFTAGLGFVQIGTGCFFTFTWQVFRKNSTRAMVAVLLACGALGATWQGLVGASVGANMTEVYTHTRPWAMGVVALVAATFYWTALESLAYHRKLMRRLALGLAQSEIVNRFWLWGMGALATAGICTMMLVPMAMNIPPLQSPLTLTFMAIAAVVNSTCWFFAFFPPQAYLERVRFRSAA